MAIKPGGGEILAEVEATEHHFHNTEHWFGLRVPQTATLWADGATLTPYQFTSGNNDYGAWVQLIGPGDTPHVAGNIKFDPHRIKYVAASEDTAYRLQFVWGTTTAADALAAGNITEPPPVILDSVNPQHSVQAADEVKFPQIDVGTSVWGRCWNVTNLATIDAFIGSHEYDE